MTSFLSHLHAELRSARLTRRGATHNADDVPRGVHKSYPRMEHIRLPAPAAMTTTLTEALAHRHSTFSKSAATPLSLHDLGSVLGHALQKHPTDGRRHYPSGGGLYPIETYVIAADIEGATGGIFHYNPSDHALAKLWKLPHTVSMKDLAKKPEWLIPAALIVFTSVWKRSSAKYGELAYQHALLEAGHMSENVLLVAEALHLEARPYAGFDDARIAELLDLDEENEQTVHTVILSKINGPSDFADENERI